MHRFVLNWDEYFMGLSLLAALRSKDPNSQVGAAIVSPQQRILGTGYNGFIAGVDESQFPWEREGEWLDTKYPYVVHAEANAILNSTQSDLRDCRIYVTLFSLQRVRQTDCPKRNPRDYLPAGQIPRFASRPCCPAYPRCCWRQLSSGGFTALAG
jgi:hypothetical protein